MRNVKYIYKLLYEISWMTNRKYVFLETGIYLVYCIQYNPMIQNRPEYFSVLYKNSFDTITI